MVSSALVVLLSAAVVCALPPRLEHDLASLQADLARLRSPAADASSTVSRLARSSFVSTGTRSSSGSGSGSASGSGHGSGNGAGSGSGSGSGTSRLYHTSCLEHPLTPAQFVPQVTQFTDITDGSPHQFQYVLPSGYIMLKAGATAMAYRNLLGFSPVCKTVLAPLNKAVYARAEKCAAAPADDCDGAEKALATGFLGADARVYDLDARSNETKWQLAKDAADRLSDKLGDTKSEGAFTLWGLRLDTILKAMEKQAPLFIVGGAFRDALAGSTSKIDDIDVSTPLTLGDAQDAIVKVYADKGIPITENGNVLDTSGIRAASGMLKLNKVAKYSTLVPEIPEDLVEKNVACGDISDLDVGTFKVDALDGNIKYHHNKGPGIVKKALDKAAAYGSGMSIKLDTRTRDFSFNAVYFDRVNNVVIDGSGEGLDAFEKKGTVDLSVANPTEFEDIDFGGELRMLRFKHQKSPKQGAIAKETVANGKVIMKLYAAEDLVDDYVVTDADLKSACEALDKKIPGKTVNLDDDCVNNGGMCGKPWVKKLTKSQTYAELAAHILYKMFSKLFKGKDTKSETSNMCFKTKAYLDGLDNIDPCKPLLQTLKNFFMNPVPVKGAAVGVPRPSFVELAKMDFPSTTEKSSGIFQMIKEMDNYFKATNQPRNCPKDGLWVEEDDGGKKRCTEDNQTAKKK